jgi:two-component system chemotaxis response regulator CheB
MSPPFLQGFASWLSNVSGWRIELVGERVPMKRGTVYLPRAEYHVVCDGDFVWADRAPPRGGHRPSADILFSSLAGKGACSAIGVVLTGMGEDGAAGLRELRAAGAFTIAEDPATAVVYGMPEAAMRAGAVCESLRLEDIAARLLELVAAKREAL